MTKGGGDLKIHLRVRLFYFHHHFHCLHHLNMENNFPEPNLQPFDTK